MSRCSLPALLVLPVLPVAAEFPTALFAVAFLDPGPEPGVGPTAEPEGLYEPMLPGLPVLPTVSASPTPALEPDPVLPTAPVLAAALAPIVEVAAIWGTVAVTVEVVAVKVVKQA